MDKKMKKSKTKKSKKGFNPAKYDKTKNRYSALSRLKLRPTLAPL